MTLPRLTDVQAELYRRSLYEFVKASWPVLHPNANDGFIDGWHIQAICDHLGAVTRGQIKKLIINIAPRTTKSMITSIDWPAWAWIDNPTLRWVFTGYNQQLTTSHSVWCRRLIESPWYREKWGDRFYLTTDQNEKRYFENSLQGARSSFGMGSVTGQGGDINVCDDPHDRADWTRPTQLTKACEVYDSDIYPAVNDPVHSRRVVVMQRIHRKDLTGFLEGRGDWEKLIIPTEYDPKRSKVSSIGWKDPRKKKGELLNPRRYGPTEVESLKKRPRTFNAQHQQAPASDDGTVFKRSWFRFYLEDPRDLARSLDSVILSVDAAFKDFEESSQVALQAWGSRGADRILLDRRLEHLDFLGTLNAIGAMYQSWGHVLKATIVEDKANGTAIINTLRRKVAGIIPWPPEGQKMDSKISRALSEQHVFEAGNVWLPAKERCPWVEEFIEYMVDFPDGDYDDDIDAAVQAQQYFDRGLGTLAAAMPHGIGHAQGWI